MEKIILLRTLFLAMNPCFPKFPSREWRKHPLLVILYSLFLILCFPCCLHSRVLVLVLCSLYIALYSQKNLNSIHSLAPQFAQPTWNLPSCEFLFAMSYKAMQYYYHLKCWLCEWMNDCDIVSMAFPFLYSCRQALSAYPMLGTEDIFHKTQWRIGIAICFCINSDWLQFYP